LRLAQLHSVAIPALIAEARQRNRIFGPTTTGNRLLEADTAANAGPLCNKHHDRQ
jgi:hypothetical protein